MRVFVLVCEEQHHEDPTEVTVLGVFTRLDLAQREVNSDEWEENKDGTWTIWEHPYKWTITHTEVNSNGSK